MNYTEKDLVKMQKEGYETETLDSIEKVADAILDISTKYNLPLEVLQDVNKRLADNQDDLYYAKQQLRYIVNVAVSKIRKEAE